jgi:antitoxin VapB
MTIAKIFMSGNSQAVRLPKEVRFPADVREVVVERQGDRLILEPLESTVWPESFWHSFGSLADDFERPAAVPQRREDLEL